jgi:hypothetical protein
MNTQEINTVATIFSGFSNVILFSWLRLFFNTVCKDGWFDSWLIASYLTSLYQVPYLFIIICNSVLGSVTLTSNLWFCDNALDLHVGGSRFEYPSDYLLSWLRFCAEFLSPSSRVSRNRWLFPAVKSLLIAYHHIPMSFDVGCSLICAFEIALLNNLIINQ